MDLDERPITYRDDALPQLSNLRGRDKVLTARMTIDSGSSSAPATLSESAARSFDPWQDDALWKLLNDPVGSLTVKDEASRALGQPDPSPAPEPAIQFQFDNYKGGSASGRQEWVVQCFEGTRFIDVLSPELGFSAPRMLAQDFRGLPAPRGFTNEVTGPFLGLHASLPSLSAFWKPLLEARLPAPLAPRWGEESRALVDDKALVNELADFLRDEPQIEAVEQDGLLFIHFSLTDAPDENCPLLRKWRYAIAREPAILPMILSLFPMKVNDKVESAPRQLVAAPFTTYLTETPCVPKPILNSAGQTVGCVKCAAQLNDDGSYGVTRIMTTSWLP